MNKKGREAELNVILPRVNNFDIKQKKVWNIFFITRSGKIKVNIANFITTPVFS